MNIIKFKDSLRPGDSMFNTFLKGKYAYWVRMRYVVPFEVITPQEYILSEHNDDYLKKFHGKYVDILKDKALNAWVDEDATEKANDIQAYVRANKFTTDPEITIDEVKKFRTWLAKNLLELDQTISGKQKYEFLDEDITHVLQYYAQGMYDEVIKWLSKYGQPSTSIDTIRSECGCNVSIADLSLILNTCDPIGAYRKSIHDKMVEWFGDMNFWIQLSIPFLSEFKAYIDNIIKLNLPFDHVSFSDFTDCLCGKSSGQLHAMEILGRLSRSLELIIENNAAGNRNYISDAFMDWARDLYELMYWD